MVSSLAVWPLQSFGHQVRIIMPAYRDVLEKGIARDTGIRFHVSIAGRSEGGRAAHGDARRRHSGLFHSMRPVLRSALSVQHPGRAIILDNAENDCVLSRARPGSTPPTPARRMSSCARLASSHGDHVLQGPAGIVSRAFLGADGIDHPQPRISRTVSSQSVGLLGLDQNLFTARHLEFYSQINFLKGANRVCRRRSPR